MPNEATADYEALRRGVLDGARGDRDLGLALLMRRGMAAWIRAWSTCAALPPLSKLPPPGAVLALPPGVRGDMTRLLVTMALTTTQTEVQS